MPIRVCHFFVFILLFNIQPAALHADALTSSVDASAVPEKKRVSSGLYLSPKDAHHAMTTRSDVVFIDVRDPREFQFVGFPTSVSANIPFLLIDDALVYDKERDQYKMVPNTDFVSHVARFLDTKGVGPSTHIIVQCRSGGRSAKAANALSSGGYTSVWQQVEGMEGDKDKSSGHRTVNGWKNAGLPWTYALTQEISYQPADLK